MRENHESKKEEFLKKETSHFNSVYPSTHNYKPKETSLNKNEIIDNKKLSLYEKEIASLKSVKYRILLYKISFLYNKNEFM